jgi:hypothetical protein
MAIRLNFAVEGAQELALRSTPSGCAAGREVTPSAPCVHAESNFRHTQASSAFLRCHPIVHLPH